MTKEEYAYRKVGLEINHSKAKYLLDKEYAYVNSIVKIGDVIKDHRISIKVDHISIYRDISGYPCCSYTGSLLTKKGEPFKTGERDSIVQCNLWSINGEPYDPKN